MTASDLFNGYQLHEDTQAIEKVSPHRFTFYTAHMGLAGWNS